MKRLGLLLCTILALCSCTAPRIDENYAACAVKEKLSLADPLTAQKLTGGLSGAKIFKVTSGTNSYVIRFIAPAHKNYANAYHRIANELEAFKHASDNGYDPHLYYADAKQALAIVEYLPSQHITFEMRKSDQLYSYLGQLLRTIHAGSPLSATRDFFERIDAWIAFLRKNAQSHAIPLDAIETIAAECKKALTPHLILKPCHNDLNPNNLMFMGDSFKAIDYELAAQADPYYDLATVSLFYCVGSTAHEDVLFQTYLGTMPTAIERAKLFLMKQIVMLSYALVFLKKVPEKLTEYENLHVPSLLGFVIERAKQAHAGVEEQEIKVRFAKVLINTAIENNTSPEFREAVQRLSTTH